MAPALALGTAQFGLDYGIANREGKVCGEAVASILQLARAQSVEWLDTAAAYGDAETVLAGEPLAASFRLCTKIGSTGATLVSDLERELAESLTRLQRLSVDVLLLHRPDALIGPHADAVLAWAADARESGKIGGFGVSLYRPSEIEYALLPGIDWVQIPVSILAQEWISSGALQRLLATGVRVQVRSLLAQGLLAVDPTRVPEALKSLAAPLTRLRAAAAALDRSPIDLALAFAAQLPVDLLVLGVQSRAQLADCLTATQATDIQLEWANFVGDPEVLDPRRWPAGLKIEA